MQGKEKANILFDPVTRMVVIGLKDGKTIDTCYKADKNYVNQKVSKGYWRKIS